MELGDGADVLAIEGMRFETSHAVDRDDGSHCLSRVVKQLN